MQDVLRRELEHFQQLSALQRQVEVARIHVEQEILLLSCPRCKQAFLDFNGCWALVCSRCGCGFCGWCLTDCDGDAHHHIQHDCTEVPPRHDPLFPFGGFDTFQEHHRQRKGRLLLDYIIDLDEDTRHGVVRELRALLPGVVPREVEEKL